MESLLSQLWFAVPVHDPFAGTLVWGTAGLGVMVVWAAFVGTAVGALRGGRVKPQPAAEHRPNHEDWRDAA
jgi:hypothetical protein